MTDNCEDRMRNYVVKINNCSHCCMSKDNKQHFKYESAKCVQRFPFHSGSLYV